MGKREKGRERRIKREREVEGKKGNERRRERGREKC